MLSRKYLTLLWQKSSLVAASGLNAAPLNLRSQAHSIVMLTGDHLQYS